MSAHKPPHSGEPGPDLEATSDLLALVRQGDRLAADRLALRFLPILRRWARGRLPGYARDLADTEDLVQVTLLRALDHIEEFEPRREGAFLAYLRRILLNSVRDHVRRVGRRPGHDELRDELRDPALVVDAVGMDTLLIYERALASLPPQQQEAVILRVEFHYTYPEIAEALDCPSPNAARMMIVRALARLAEVMDGGPKQS